MNFGVAIGPYGSWVGFGSRPKLLGRYRGVAMGKGKACRDKIFSVATRLAQGWLLGCRDLGFSIATEAGVATRSARATRCRACALYNVVHCLEHCS